jgi:protein SCO1/2
MNLLSRSLFLVIVIGLLLVPMGRGEDAPLFQKPTVVPHELNIGDMMPDVPLRGRDGCEVHLRDFLGKAVAINFFYSRCTVATFCPLVSRNFDEAQTLLARMHVREQCHLLSLSLDPARDTPEILAAYAKGYHANSDLWTFATASEADLHDLGDAVGLEFKWAGDRLDHNLRTVIVDSHGCIRHVFRGDGWTPQELVAELRAAAHRFH